MDPDHSQKNEQPNPSSSGNSTADSPSDFLLDAEYVSKLRKTDFDGLVIGENATCFEISLGFERGDCVVSKAASHALTRDEIWVAWLQHGIANWGDVGADIIETNFHALEFGGELRSAYHTPTGIRFTIVTNSERTLNTIQLDGDPSSVAAVGEAVEKRILTP